MKKQSLLLIVTSISLCLPMQTRSEDNFFVQQSPYILATGLGCVGGYLTYNIHQWYKKNSKNSGIFDKAFKFCAALAGLSSVAGAITILEAAPHFDHITDDLLPRMSQYKELCKQEITLRNDITKLEGMSSPLDQIQSSRLQKLYENLNKLTRQQRYTSEQCDEAVMSIAKVCVVQANITFLTACVVYCICASRDIQHIEEAKKTLQQTEEPQLEICI